jgi:uncharacterized protein (DUF1499 family)
MAQKDDPRQPIDFATLALKPSPNQALVLPAGFASTAEPHVTSPVFPVPAERLVELVRETALAQPRTKLIASHAAKRQMTFVQRSALFRFPDYVTIEAMPAGEGQSAAAFYSRSRYGYSDLGVNRKRVQAWLAALEAATE